MLCRKCGNELKMGAKFCYSCGYYVDEDEDYNNVSFFDKKNCFELQGSDEYLSTMIRARVRVVKKTIE